MLMNVFRAMLCHVAVMTGSSWGAVLGNVLNTAVTPDDAHPKAPLVTSAHTAQPSNAATTMPDNSATAEAY